MIKLHSIQSGSYILYFLEIHDKQSGKMHLQTTLYLILAILETFCTEERKTEAQSTNFLVTSDKKVYPLDVQVALIPIKHYLQREEYRLLILQIIR